MHATCFGLSKDHPHVCQYKNIYKKTQQKSKRPHITFTVFIELKNKKAKVNLELARNAQRGRKGTVLLFLEPRRLMGVGCQSHAPGTPVPIE